jgi:hypothetical protein
MTGVTIRRATRIGVALLLLGALPGRAAEPDGLLDRFDRARGMIETRTACHLLDLYLALTPEQRGQGLMHVRKLDEYEGMLFPTRQPAVVSMWMKNTYIPLDLLFIRADGHIARIAGGTPLSEDTVSSIEPVTAVLELNGGFAASHGVTLGDRFALLD